MLYRYFSILLACTLVVVGLQIPAFIDQYQHRLSAHLNEVATNLAGFQRIADEHHRGSLPALIEMHRQSAEPTFSSEAAVIEEMYDRFVRFSTALARLEASLAGRIYQVAINPDREIFEETASNYTYTVTLNTDSAICAGVLLLSGILLSDLLRFLCLRPFHRRHA